MEVNAIGIGAVPMSPEPAPPPLVSEKLLAVERILVDVCEIVPVGPESRIIVPAPADILDAMLMLPVSVRLYLPFVAFTVAPVMVTLPVLLMKALPAELMNRLPAVVLIGGSTPTILPPISPAVVVNETVPPLMELLNGAGSAEMKDALVRENVEVDPAADGSTVIPVVPVFERNTLPDAFAVTSLVLMKTGAPAAPMLPPGAAIVTVPLAAVVLSSPVPVPVMLPEPVA